MSKSMLDTRNSSTAHVFAASAQLDLILRYAKVATLRTGADRRYSVEIARPAFAALRWLNAERYGGALEIEAGLSNLEKNLDVLATLPTLESPRGHCTACEESVRSPSQYDPLAYCSSCLNRIMPPIVELRTLFGIDGI